MAAHDSSWEIFRAELKRWMELRRFTNKALAEAINHDLASTGLSSPVDEQIIKRWRHSTSPPLMTLKVVARILGMSSDPTGRTSYDPTYLPRLMGILDAAPENSELIEAAYRLQTIRAKLADAQSALSVVTADEGVVNIVRAATDAGLGVAVLPVREGPRGYPMHVADRIDLRDPAVERPAPQASAHPALADALHDAFAIVSRRVPRFCGEELRDDVLANWAVQYIGRPRSSVVHREHAGLPAIAITSTTTTAWPDDIGDLVSMVLGYSFTTTRELARELVSDPYTAESLRSDIHETFLYASAPTRRVWAHHGATLPTNNDDAPFRDAEGRSSSGLVIVSLVEEDAILRHAASRPAGRSGNPSTQETQEHLTHLVAARDAVDERARRIGEEGRVFRLPVRYFPDAEDRWLQVFQTTLKILVILRDLGVEVNLAEMHERLVRAEPQVAPQVLRWLADHDAPFVDPRYRTTR